MLSQDRCFRIVSIAHLKGWCTKNFLQRCAHIQAVQRVILFLILYQTDPLLIIKWPRKSKGNPVHISPFCKMTCDNRSQCIEDLSGAGPTLDFINAHTAHKVSAVCHQRALDGTPTHIECQYELIIHRYSRGSFQPG